MRGKSQVPNLTFQINKNKHRIFGICNLGFETLSETGFTLIELIVVIAMLGILFLALVFTFNPAAQYEKAKDAQREHDLEQIKTALDSYYNDHSCYPDVATFTALMGKQWANGSVIYMQKVPQDPENGTVNNYVYQTDNSSCPQWNVVYTDLQGKAVPSNPCPLSSRAGVACLPQDYSGNYNYCVVSGNVDCSFIASSSIVTNNNNNGGGGGGGGGNSTPTPTGGPLSCPGDQYYGCTGNDACNSIFPKDHCIQNGGTTAFCYCDNLCRVNGVKQCAN